MPHSVDPDAAEIASNVRGPGVRLRRSGARLAGGRPVPFFPAVFLVLLAASIPLKAWTISAAHDAPGADWSPALARVLGDDGFTVGFERDLLGYPAVIGRAGSCRVWLGAVAADGWHRDIVVSSASNDLTPSFFFAGRAYPDQPAWSTWLNEKAHWVAGAFARSPRSAPVVAALIGRDCDIDRSRWAERLGRL